MEIKKTQQNDILIIEPSGRLDSVTSPALDQYIAPNLIGQPRLLLDLAALDYISSAGLRVLLGAAKKVKQLGGRLILCGLKPHIHEVFEMSGFLSILEIRPDQADALACMSA